MNDWVVEVKDFEEEILEGLYTLLNENGINKVKELINLKNKQMQELTNNWNELEEWIKIKYKEYSKNKKNHIDVAMSGTFYAVLDKMKEIKNGGNNE